MDRVDGDGARRWRKCQIEAPFRAASRTAGPQFAHMTVFVLPPRLSWSNLVSFESRYGMCWLLPSTKADITFPRALRLRFILVASFSRSPVACVLDWRSEPAKSTKLSLPTVICSPCRTLPVESQHSTMIVKMAWDLELPAFMAVAPTDLFFLPACITWSISCEDLTCAERLRHETAAALSRDAWTLMRPRRRRRGGAAPRRRRRGDHVMRGASRSLDAVRTASVHSRDV